MGGAPEKVTGVGSAPESVGKLGVPQGVLPRVLVLILSQGQRSLRAGKKH